MTLVIRKLCAGYGNVRILQDISFEVGNGEIVSLVGRNGSGRSTTAKAVVGLVRPISGSILLNGVEQAGRRPYEIVRGGIAFVPEDRQVFDNLSVQENLILGRPIQRSGRVDWTIERIYQLFPRLAERRRVHAGHLSGGEQQILTVCRSLLGNPKVILIDEPTEGLAPQMIEQIVDLISEIRREGIAVVLVEQKLTVALRISDRVCVVGHGTTVYTGTPSQLRDNTEIRQRWLEVA